MSSFPKRAEVESTRAYENPTRKPRNSFSSLKHKFSRGFAPDFMSSYTEYEPFVTLLKQQGWVDSEGTLRYEVTVGDADRMVRETTKFEDGRGILFAAQDRLREPPSAEPSTLRTVQLRRRRLEKRTGPRGTKTGTSRPGPDGQTSTRNGNDSLERPRRTRCCPVGCRGCERPYGVELLE